MPVAAGGLDVEKNLTGSSMTTVMSYPGNVRPGEYSSSGRGPNRTGSYRTDSIVGYLFVDLTVG